MDGESQSDAASRIKTTCQLNDGALSRFHFGGDVLMRERDARAVKPT